MDNIAAKDMMEAYEQSEQLTRVVVHDGLENIAVAIYDGLHEIAIALERANAHKADG